MTDYIVKTEKGIITEYADDETDRVILVTSEGIFRRYYKMPPEIKKVIGVLGKLKKR